MGPLLQEHYSPRVSWYNHCGEQQDVCARSVSQSCPTLRPMDRSPPGTGSSVHRILRARTLERIAIAFSKNSTDAPLKTKSRITMQSCNSTPGHISRENEGLKGHVQPAGHCSPVYKSQDAEATCTSGSGGMERRRGASYTVERYSDTERE